MLNPDVADLLTRAATIARAPKLPEIASSSQKKYAEVAAALDDAMIAAGSGWNGIESYAQTQRYGYLQRAAWVRHCREQVDQLVQDIRSRRVPDDYAISELKRWVPEAERYGARGPVAPNDRTEAGAWLSARRAAGQGIVASTSKRVAIRSLPADWMDRLWGVAEGRGYRHLDALAVLICAGCRPAEVCLNPVQMALEGSGGLALVIVGAKVWGDYGQPWRRLVVTVKGGAAEHLAALVKNGAIEIQCSASPAALSMGVSDIGKKLDLGRRISAYDLRHQRSADVRNIFGDRELVAAWLGHTSDSTQSHYGRLPKSKGCRGPKPISVAVPRTVRVHNKSLFPVRKLQTNS